MSPKRESRLIYGWIHRAVLFLVVAATVGGIMATEAWAHRDRGPNDPCRKQIGASFLHMTLYQPLFNPDAEYCEELPRAGKAVLVVDVTPGELRQAPISVEVVSTGQSGESQTVLSLPPKVYERGAVDSEVLFEDGNEYVVRVGVDLGNGKERQQFAFPVQVAAWYRAMIKPMLLVVGLMVLTVISVIRYRMSARANDSLQRVPASRITD